MHSGEEYVGYIAAEENRRRERIGHHSCKLHDYIGRHQLHRRWDSLVSAAGRDLTTGAIDLDGTTGDDVSVLGRLCRFDFGKLLHELRLCGTACRRRSGGKNAVARTAERDCSFAVSRLADHAAAFRFGGIARLLYSVRKPLE